MKKVTIISNYQSYFLINKKYSKIKSTIEKYEKKLSIIPTLKERSSNIFVIPSDKSKKL